MLDQSGRRGAELIAPTDDDEEGRLAQPARGGCRGCSSSASVGAAVLVGALLILCSAALRFGRVDLGTLMGARNENVKRGIAAVVVDAAKARKMEAPAAPVKAPTPALHQPTADPTAPRKVRWGLVMKQMDEGAQLLDTQKFRLLKHPDTKITLRDQHGFHLDATENRTLVIGAVTTAGVLVSAPIVETGKFIFEYNFDNTVSLRHSNGNCLISTEEGNIYMSPCNKDRGAGTFFSPTVFVSEGLVAFQSATGHYLTVFETWVQDYRTSVVMVNKTVADQSPVKCSKFYRDKRPDGLVSLKTTRASYLTAGGGELLGADADEVGPEQLFREVRNADGSVSLAAFASSAGSATSTAASNATRRLRGGRSRQLAYLELQGNGSVSVAGQNATGASILKIQNNTDGTVSLTKEGRYVCAAERTITVLTCETRKSWAPEWSMQGVSTTVTIKNVCFGLEWYGFKTKVDAYLAHVAEMARTGQPDQIVILVDNSDMAFGGCSYDEMLYRYDKIVGLTGAPVIAGADNAPYPTAGWPYELLEDRRRLIMQAFGMGVDQYCDHTECPKYFYKFANSGFLMGPPGDLQSLLGCMLERGWGNFGRTGYDDQQGLQACMFGEGPEAGLVALDYSGTLSMQLIRMNEWTLYEGKGKVYNRVARGMSQCFVHGNGDTMKWWWPRLFPGLDNSEDYGKAFAV